MRWKWIIGIVVGSVIAVVIALYVIISNDDFTLSNIILLSNEGARMAAESSFKEMSN